MAGPLLLVRLSIQDESDSDRVPQSTECGEEDEECLPTPSRWREESYRVQEDLHHNHRNIGDTMQIQVLHSDDVVDRRRLAIRCQWWVSVDMARCRLSRLEFGRCKKVFRDILQAFLRGRRVVGLVNVGVLNNCQENQLRGVGNNGDEKDLVARSHHRDAVISSVADRVHGMRRQFKHAIECEFLVDKVEEIAPVPCEIFDDSVGIQFDP